MQDFSQYKNTHVLITGATGFTGRILTEKLCEIGAIVHAIARPESNTGDFPENITWHIGNIADQTFINSVCQNMHYVFHIAAAFREEKTNLEFFRDIHVRSTEYLVHACEDKKLNHEFKRFVHVSTVGIHGHIEIEAADENYRVKPGDDYQLTKYEGEKWLTDYAETHPDFSYSVTRPAPIYGPGDRRLLKIFKMANGGNWIMLGSKDPYYHLIHVEDLTDIMLNSGVNPKGHREIFIAACDEAITFSQLGKLIAKTLDVPMRIIRLPLLPFYILADVCSAVCKPFGIQPPIYRRRLSIYKNDRRFDNSKIKNVLGHVIQYNNVKGIETTAQAYIDKGWLVKKTKK